MQISTLFWTISRNKSNLFLKEFIFSVPIIFFLGLFKRMF